MNYYANEEERARLIAGLRDLTEFFDANPDVPVVRQAEMLVFPPEGTDAEMFAEIDAVAGRLGVIASDVGSPAGHYSAVLGFGPVQYRAVAIPRSARNQSEGGE